MRYNHDNYRADGSPRVFLDGVEQNATKMIWADDVTGEVCFMDLEHKSCRLDEKGTVMFNGLHMDRDDAGKPILPTIIKIGKVEFRRCDT